MTKQIRCRHISCVLIHFCGQNPVILIGVHNNVVICISYITTQGSRVRPIWSHVRPNFSRVRLTKIPGRTGASSHSRKEKKVSATQKLCGSTKDTPVRLISWSKPIRDSEGRTPPSDWPQSRYSCMCVCALTNASRVLLQSDREKEVSSRDACSVANLATFSAFVDPHSNFLFSKKSN